MIVGLPQASGAVAVPNAAFISPLDGLQPSVVVVPLAMSVDPARPTVHGTVLAAVEILPQASLAVNVLVLEREQPLLEIFPSFEVIVGLLQASVAVAAPRAALISALDGLQPRVIVLLPVRTIVGAVLSTVHVTVLDAVDVLPQASLAVHVLV